MLINPKLYEINTRVWIKQFGEKAALTDVPDDYFKQLADKGINIIYLMGIWKTSPNLVPRCCFSEGLINDYNKSLKDWTKEDVIGSPFSIDTYTLAPSLGKPDDLKIFCEKLNKIGLKLVLDFVPNHFSAGSEVIKTNPDIFLQGDEELLSASPQTFFRSSSGRNKIFAHGRDPLFPPWTDTIQVNYFSKEAREIMTNILLELGSVCDGVRCDMAMLILNNVFHNSWLGVINKSGLEKPKDEFWKTAISEVRNKYPDFFFLAEAYWDLEWELQQLGFDFTYDKRLTDRLAADDIYGVKAHLMADAAFQSKSVRFIENHDETRAVIKFGKPKSLAAATVMSTVTGMKFYYDGQFEGKKTRLPVQLCREPVERVSKSISGYYKKLLDIIGEDVFTNGEWQLINLMSAGPGNNSYQNLFAWQWKLDKDIRLVVINYSDVTSQGRIQFEVPTDKTRVYLVDLLTGAKYDRSVEQMKTIGLFVELRSYRSHIFSVIL